MKCIFFVSSLLCLAGAARASDTGISVILGSPTGLGVELTQGITPSFNVRLGAGLPMEPTVKDVELGHNKHEVDLKLGGLGAFADWHPWRGNFRVSGGVMTLRNDLAFRRTKGPFDLDGTDYSSREIQSVSGVTHLDRTIAPTILVGWGNAARSGRRVGFQIEVGAAWAGDAETTLTATGPLASDPVVVERLRDEARNITEDSKGILAGVFRFGVTYRF